MTKEQTQECFRIIEEYNPNNEILTEKEYQRIKGLYDIGDFSQIDRLRELSFYFAGEWLLGRYLTSDADVQLFGDDLHETLFVTSKLLPIEKNLASYQVELSEKLKNRFRNKRRHEKQVNAYLNYDWQEEVGENEVYYGDHSQLAIEVPTELKRN